MAASIRKALSEAVIQRLADEKTHRRGADYFSQGYVESIEETDGQFSGIVHGNPDYTVVLTGGDGILDYSCDCPIGHNGAFCKHCVAVALACLKPVRRKAKAITVIDAAKALREQDKETLIETLLGWAKDDKQLRERLVLFAADSLAPDNRAPAVEQAFKKAVTVRGYPSYRETAGWARGVHRAIDGIEKLLDDDQPAAAIALCESALQMLQPAMERVDDSAGHYSGLRDRLEDIHYAACEEACPDGEKLAKRLFDFEMYSRFEVFYDAVETYAQILGAKGLQAYRKLAEAEWNRVPKLTSPIGSGRWGEDLRITKIMESLAKSSGDLEELIAVMSRDLSSPSTYLQIAEHYREDQQNDNALLWIEKGLSAFPQRSDSGLIEFAVEEYQRRERHDESMKLSWEMFTKELTFAAYRALESHAKRAKVWPEYRELAIEEIRLRIAKEKKRTPDQRLPFWALHAADHSRLVEIFIYEDKFEDAWREAKAGGCEDNLWVQLAEWREKEFPEEAATVYIKAAGTAMARVVNSRYEHPVKLLEKAADAMNRAGRSAYFARNLLELRVKYGNKRNFMKLLEERNLS